MDVDFIVIWKFSAKINRAQSFYRWIYLPQKDIFSISLKKIFIYIYIIYYFVTLTTFEKSNAHCHSFNLTRTTRD